MWPTLIGSVMTPVKIWSLKGSIAKPNYHTMKLFYVFLVFLVLLSVVSSAPTQQNLQAFASWLQTHKIASKCNLANFPGQGFGGVARGPISEGEVLVQIPTGVLVSNNRIKTESVLKDFTEWHGVFTFEPGMVWLLLEKNNPNSPWKPYLDILPDSYPTHPLSWTDEELSETKGTSLPETTNAIKTHLQATWEHLDEKLFKPNANIFVPEQYNLAALTWAFQTWNSRSWGISSTDVADTVLVPLADMFNHQAGAGLGGLTEDKAFFQINATKEYQQGEQVFDNYGPKNNFDLLSAYGFVLEFNPDDSMVLQFTLKPTNLVHSIVEPILRAVEPNYQSMKIRKNKIPLELLRLFRLSVMEFSELEKLNDALSGKGVSLKNELRAFRSVIKALSTVLQAFDTTIEQDTELLKREDLSTNQRNGIILRKSQKELITNNILIFGKMWENILLSGELYGGVAI